MTTGIYNIYHMLFENQLSACSAPRPLITNSRDQLFRKEPAQAGGVKKKPAVTNYGRFLIPKGLNMNRIFLMQEANCIPITGNFISISQVVPYQTGLISGHVCETALQY
jgi:hypothetical protein